MSPRSFWGSRSPRRSKAPTGAPTSFRRSSRPTPRQDVANLHALKTRLDTMLVREGRMELAQACFDFLPFRAALDVAGWEDKDIFAP